MQKLQNYQVNMDKVIEMHRYTTQLSDCLIACCGPLNPLMHSMKTRTPRVFIECMNLPWCGVDLM